MKHFYKKFKSALKKSIKRAKKTMKNLQRWGRAHVVKFLSLAFISLGLVIGGLWSLTGNETPPPETSSSESIDASQAFEQPPLTSTTLEETAPNLETTTLTEAPVTTEATPPPPEEEAPALPPVDKIVPKKTSEKGPEKINGPVKIAILIDDVGLNVPNAARATRLSENVSLAFMPYAPDARGQVKRAIEAGHDVIIHMPMEPMNGTLDPGPHALRTRMSDQEITDNVAWDMSQFDGYIGVNNHMGSKFTTNEHALRIVLNILKAKGDLFFLDSVTHPNTVGSKIAEELGLPHLKRDVFLDNEENAASIRQELAITQKIARQKGYAIAIGHPHTVTLEVLEDWIKNLPEDQYELVPLHALVK